jgi:dephospho-CoA kinase
MIILGLTGSIGMGKSTAAGLLRRSGVPVYDADRVVHRLLGRGGAAVEAVAAEFPGTVTDGRVDRQALGARVFGDAGALARLERIIHPLVRRAERKFLAASARQRRALVVLDIPLLFESNGDARCDATIVVSAPYFLQRLRVMQRSGMDERRFAAILAHQMPDRLKRARADFIVLTGLDKRLTLARLRRIVRQLLAKPPSPPCWSPHARNRSRYRNHRARPQRRASHRRGGGDRADQRGRYRAILPSLRQSRT